VNEISLVDSPACASEDEYGRKTPRAVVALYKRDHSDTNNDARKGRKMGFKQILKSAKTRAEIVAAVEQKAVKIAKREGISGDAALVKAWGEHPEAREAYEAAPKPVAKKAEPRMFRATPAEAELDKRARKRMRATGKSYAKAASEELEADPSLYDRYQKELAAGATYECPEPQYMDIPGSNSDGILNKSSRMDDDEEDEDDDDFEKCASCEKRMRKSDKFCPSCGKAKRKAGPGGNDDARLRLGKI